MGCAQQMRGKGLIVVLDGGGGGEGLDQQSRVLEGMEQYCPLGLVWVYTEGANPPLRGFVEKVGKVVVDTQAVPDTNGTGEGPVLRLAGSNGAVKTGASLSASDVLDHDELAALLKPEE